jgi:hypothetical protein
MGLGLQERMYDSEPLSYCSSPSQSKGGY